jgi:hypothetical protein
MSIEGIFSLLEAAARFEALSRDMSLVGEGILSELAVLVRDQAKSVIGTYEYGWPALGPEAVAKHGDTPLLETGELKGSISGLLHHSYKPIIDRLKIALSKWCRG